VKRCAFRSETPVSFNTSLWAGFFAFCVGWWNSLFYRKWYIDISCFSVLEQLPRSNVTLLSHFLCVLHHVARRAAHNLMSATNLGVCVGPSLLWAHTPTPASSRAVPNLVELLIVRCELLLGPHVPLLLGDPPERDLTRQDSGAEESDSLHCESQCLFTEFLVQFMCVY
jgi:hypothetical protein